MFSGKYEENCFNCFGKFVHTSRVAGSVSQRLLKRGDSSFHDAYNKITALYFNGN